MFTKVQCWWNSPYGAQFTWKTISAEDCTPANLVRFAQEQNCLFVTAPTKYGCRQFCNPDKLPKGGTK